MILLASSSMAVWALSPSLMLSVLRWPSTTKSRANQAKSPHVPTRHFSIFPICSDKHETLPPPTMGDNDYEELTSVPAPTAMGGGNRPRICIVSETDYSDCENPLDNSPTISLPWTQLKKCSHRTSKNTQREFCAIAPLIHL